MLLRSFRFIPLSLFQILTLSCIIKGLQAETPSRGSGEGEGEEKAGAGEEEEEGEGAEEEEGGGGSCQDEQVISSCIDGSTRMRLPILSVAVVSRR